MTLGLRLKPQLIGVFLDASALQAAPYVFDRPDIFCDKTRVRFPFVYFPFQTKNSILFIGKWNSVTGCHAEMRGISSGKAGPRSCRRPQESEEGRPMYSSCCGQNMRFPRPAASGRGFRRIVPPVVSRAIPRAGMT
jgi:hypothetical protein